MGRIVVMAEKPSVGRDIARVLGCKTQGEGCLFNDTYLVTWAVGHLVGLADPDEVDEKYKKWRMDTLPILPEAIPLKVLPKTRSQFKTVKGWICDKDTDSLICATDAGREGELIFRFIYDKAGCKKPFNRLWISSMTDEAIKDGFAAIRPGADYEGLYKSALCRAHADWLVGMNASRAFTLRYNVLLSIGRVQTPTLAILVKRQNEILAFKPEEFCTVTAGFGDYSGIWFKEGQDNDTRIPTQQQAEEIAAAVRKKPAQITKVETQQKQELPPQLYDLTTLQRDANRMLGFTASKTLKLAQSLYETYKYVTYPRTDSRCLPHDMVERTGQAIGNVPNDYQRFVPLAMPNGKLPVTKRVFDDTKISDHHAIIPTTKRCDMSRLPPDEKKLMDLIIRRLLAAFCPVHLYDQTRVITVAEGHTFRTMGKVITQMGWKELYTTDAKKQKAEDAPLPALSAGDERTVHTATVKKDATKPPLPHTDASLLSAMEHAGREMEDDALRDAMKGSGLGTPATRAATIDRLINVGYAQRKGKALLPTEKGMQLIRIAPPEIASPETTGRWELALEQITKGQQDPVRFMEGIRRLSEFLVTFARDNKGESPFPPEERRKGGKRVAARPETLPNVVCPVCGKGGITENSRAFACTEWKAGCKFTIWKDCLTRSSGPMLSGKLLCMLLDKKSLRGSTGTLEIKDGYLSFYPDMPGEPSVRRSLVYDKMEKK